MNLQQIRNRVEQLKGQRDKVVADVSATQTRLAALNQEVIDTEEARVIIQTVAQQTQQRLEYRISEVVSLALAAVFDDPYTLRIVFVQRRGKTECDILFERDGEQQKPFDASGGGAVDVAALALRIALWSLGRNRWRHTLIFDEPMKMLSRDRMPAAAAMIAEISRRMQLQVIMVSHSEELIEAADRYFTVTIDKGVSYVEQSEAAGGNAKGCEGGDKQINTEETGGFIGVPTKLEKEIRRKSRLLSAPRRNADIQDIGDKGKEQSGMDGHSQTRRSTRTAGSENTAPRDNGERQTSIDSDNKTRRRRT